MESGLPHPEALHDGRVFLNAHGRCWQGAPNQHPCCFCLLTLNQFFVHSEVESLETASSHPLAHSSHTLLVKERRVRHCGHRTLGKSPGWVRIYAGCLDSIAPDRSDVCYGTEFKYSDQVETGNTWFSIPTKRRRWSYPDMSSWRTEHQRCDFRKKYRPETFFPENSHEKYPRETICDVLPLLHWEHSNILPYVWILELHSAREDSTTQCYCHGPEGHCHTLHPWLNASLSAASKKNNKQKKHIQQESHPQVDASGPLKINH